MSVPSPSDVLEEFLDERRGAAGGAADRADPLRSLVRDVVEARAFLENILESSTEYSIIGKDLERRIVLWNEGARRNYGYTAEEVLGRSSDMLHADADRESDVVKRMHDEALRRGKAEGRFVRRRKDGTTFVASVVITRRVDRDGNPAGYLLISRDISKDLDRERLEAHAAALERDQRLSEAADKLKTQFLANASHELRTPLNSIIGFTDLLLGGKTGPLTPAQREYLGDVAASGRHLLRLIEDIMDLTKVEADRLDFRPEPTDPEQVAREAAQSLQPQAASRRITIDLQADVRHDVRLDVGRLRQILLNFLSNALKVSPDGGKVFIRVMTHGEELRIEVEDQGPGVPRHERHRLFQPFQQIHATPSGTGLGLALTRRLAEAQGGSVGMRAGAKGCIFWARLPRLQRTDAA